jgi:hypothetical protein
MSLGPGEIAVAGGEESVEGDVVEYSQFPHGVLQYL